MSAPPRNSGGDSGPDGAATARIEAGETLVIASHNAGKCQDFAELLADQGLRLIGAADLGLPAPEETASDFLGNARIKALSAARASGHPAIGDDCGLCVEALGGDPGVYSARWGGPARSFAVAIARIEDALRAQCPGAAELPDALTGATFHCALVLAWPDGRTESAEGILPGRLRFPPAGDRSLGYEPIFVPASPSDDGRTLAEMPPAERNARNHRALAWAELRRRCFPR